MPDDRIASQARAAASLQLCSKCHAEKAATQFYARSTMCKLCHNARTRAHRLTKVEYYRAYDRARSRLPHRKRDLAERNRLYDAMGRKRPEPSNEKRQARVTVGNAIRDGKLIPAPCERCGSEIEIHAHHEDYSKPLEVMWLCTTHHGERHREINEERRRRRMQKS